MTLSSPPTTDERIGLPSSPRPIALGIGLMVLGILLFSVNDVVGKWLVATYSVGQVLLIRSLAALALLTPFIWKEGIAPFRAAPRPGLQLLRASFSTLEVAFFYAAVIYMPLADVVTYYLAGPIYVVALSALLLGERVGWRRWAAVAVGFAGVLIALSPSAQSLTWPALIALVGSVLFAFLMITTRHLRGTSDTVLITGTTAGAFVFGLFLAPIGWVTPSPRDLTLLAMLGIVAMAAHVCVNRSLKLAPASLVVPYQYLLIVFAVIFGYLVFGDEPTPAMLSGAGIIVAAGLYIFVRERRPAHDAPK